MKKLFLITISLLLTFPLVAQDRSVIEAIMQRQEQHWNEGNIDAFMEDYWKSPDLQFIGKNGVTKGWEATKARYHRSYPDRATMGTLRFTIQQVEFFSSDVAWVLGQWQLTRPEKGDAGGYFTLVFKKINNRWVIVSDHTS